MQQNVVCMTKPRLLLVGNEPDARRTLHAFTQSLLPQVDVVSVASASDALQVLRSEHVDAVLSDLHVPGMNGLDLLMHSAQLQPHAARMLCTMESADNWAIPAVNGSRVHHIFTRPLDPKHVSGALLAFFDHWGW